MKTKQSENDNKLINEHPMLLLPTVAKELGVHAAIILQQIHYWLKKELNTRDGYCWVYHSYNTWTEQFSFFSQSQIKHAIRKLEKRGILIVGNYNKRSMDKTKWYRIDYAEIERIFPLDKIIQPWDRIIQSSAKISPSLDNIVQPSDKDSQAIPEITTETTTEITNKKEDPFFENLMPDSLKQLSGFIEVWKEWFNYQKAKRNKITEFTAKRQFAKLLKEPDPIALINQSIEKNWKGLFPIEGRNNKPEPERPKLNLGNV